MERLPIERVVAAATALAAVDLGRVTTTLVMWMSVKYAGATSAVSTEVTNEQVIEFCDKYFAVPGAGDYHWYTPFTKEWNKYQSNGGWPVGSVLTQMDRPNLKMQALMEIVPDPNTETPKNKRSRHVRLADGPAYMTALEGIMRRTVKSPRLLVPPLELAIWRYRFAVPDGVTDETGLIEAMVSELHLTEVERQKVLAEEVVK